MIRNFAFAALMFAHCAAAQTVLVFGDSISAGYGLPRDAGWVHMLAQRLTQTAPDYKVVNASISGETAAGGRRRIEQALESHKPSIVLVQLGGNDGLRGARIDAIQGDLDAIVDACLRRKARVVLIGMRLPPNYGAAYVQRFQQLYATIARQRAVPLVPYLFTGFGERQDLFQADSIHPTREAQPLMLDTVWQVLAPLVTPRKPAQAQR